MVKIRLLQDCDHVEWLRLRCALWPHHSPSEHEQEMAGIRAHFNADEPGRREAVFVAECVDLGESGQSVLCGMVEVSIHKAAKGCLTDKVGYLEGWFVDAEWRSQGIGRSLVEAAESWARSQGCIEMASDTTLDYPLSPRAHERLGYQEIERCFYYRKDLSRTCNESQGTQDSSEKSQF